MESRMDKYYREDENPSMQRSSKNAKLYRDVYSDYDNLENLPIPDNTNVIDMPELRKLMRGEEDNNRRIRESKYEESVKEKVDPDKIYDINKLLEHARSENNKLKDNKHYDTSNYKILETFGDKVEPIDYDNEEDNEIEKEDILSQTRELKYQTKKISDNPVIEQIIPEDSKEFNTASLSLDILSDLKPTGDTGVTEPAKNPDFEKIYEEEIEKKVDVKEEEVEEDSDVDIIKEDVSKEEKIEKDASFYTDLYKFSSKDFEDDDEDDESKGGVIFKIILLFIFICACCFAIFYFITNYGFN